MSKKPTYEELEQRISILEQSEASLKKTVQSLKERELRCRSILETINEGVVLQSSFGQTLYLNKNAEEYPGLINEDYADAESADEFTSIINEDGSKLRKDEHPVIKALQTGRPVRNRIMGVFRGDDDLRWLGVNTSPLFNAGENKPYAVATSFSDITELKTEKDASWNYLDVAGVMILVLNERGEISFINKKGTETLGGTKEDYTGKNWFEIFTPKEILQDVKKEYQDMMDGRTEVIDYLEYYITTLSGRVKAIAWHNAILKNKDNKIIGSLCSGEDITERKEAVEKLRESEKEHRTILQTAMDGFQVINMQGEILEVNETYCEMSGYSRDELLEMKIADLETMESSETMAQRRQIMGQRGESRFTSRHRRRDGSFFDVEISVQKQTDAERIVCFLRDITEQKKAEESLREREELLNKSQEMASMGSFVWDMKKQTLIWSKNMYVIYGYDESTFKGDLFELSNKLIHPDDAAVSHRDIQEMINKYHAWDTEFRIIRADEKERIIRSKGEVEFNERNEQIKCFGINQDVTEHRLAERRIRENEEKLTRSRKMESLGLLAGGVAHDLNNVLSGIVSYPELLLMDMPEESKYRKPIQTIHDSGTRAVAIVQDLLTIARGVASVKSPLNLNDIIEEYISSPEYKKLLQYHPNVLIQTSLNRELMHINGSGIHIRKLIMNLVSNASEAIEDMGNVLISTSNRYVDRPVSGYEDVKAGEYIVLTVQDNGSGISVENLDRIFEPFFTKKVMGRSGTGLGLAVVWSIVQDHEGYIDVTSNKAGTTFEIYLPMIRKEENDEVITTTIQDYAGSGESVLVIDDEETQREVSCRMLEKLGYRAEAVSSGEDALEYLKNKNADIVLLDMIMPPGMGGRETYEKILKIRPGQKAVIVSGFAETDEVKRAQKLGAGRYVRKPLTMKNLAMAIKEELKRH